MSNCCEPCAAGNNSYPPVGSSLHGFQIQSQERRSGVAVRAVEPSKYDSNEVVPSCVVLKSNLWYWPLSRGGGRSWGVYA